MRSLDSSVRYLGRQTRRTWERMRHEPLEELADRLADDRAGVPKPILVYQFGKVGSSTVAATLAGVYGDGRVVHVHGMTSWYWDGWFSADRGDRAGAQYFADCRRWQVEAAMLRMRIEDCRDRLRLGSGEPKWSVVTPLREPVGSFVSAAFQLSEYLYPSLHGADAAARRAAADGVKGLLEGLDVSPGAAPASGATSRHPSPSDPEGLFVRVMRRYASVTRQWCAMEPGRTLGLDLLGAPFPYDKGYVVLESPWARQLVLRFEDLSNTLVEGLHSLLGTPAGMKVVSANLTAAKAYADEYRTVVATVRLPPPTVDFLLDGAYVRHCYSDAERDGFRARWAS